MKYAQGLWILSQTSLAGIIHSILFFLDRKHISLLLYVYLVGFFLFVCFYFTLLMSAGQTALFWWYNCNRQFQSHVSLLCEESSLCVCSQEMQASKLSYEHGPITFWEVPWISAMLSVLKFPLHGLSINTVIPSSGMYYGHTLWHPGWECPAVYK